VNLVHQILLSWTPLQDWALYASRTNFITHNKEGITSIPGYLSIHLLGLSIGLLIFPPTPSHFRRMITAQFFDTSEPAQNNKYQAVASRSSIDEDRYGTSSDEDVAYAKTSWIDNASKVKEDDSVDSHKAQERGKSSPATRREDGKTAIELCSYGVLYLVLFAVVRIWPSEDDVSRRLVSITITWPEWQGFPTYYPAP
jgi:hypothetical protein